MNTRRITRRDALKAFSAGAVVSSLSACATMGQKNIGRVVVVGAGFGGATAAKYLRLWSDGAVDVTLVEPSEAFISCPMSNLVLGGSKVLADVTVSYSGLDKHGVKRVRDTVSAIDVDKKQVRLASGGMLPYDRLVVSPVSSSCMTGCRDGLQPAKQQSCTRGRRVLRPSRCASS